MPSLTSYELWFYAGILIMSLAVLLFLMQIIVFVIKKKRISRKLDEEYGQPQKYNRKGEGNQIWP